MSYLTPLTLMTMPISGAHLSLLRTLPDRLRDYLPKGELRASGVTSTITHSQKQRVLTTYQRNGSYCEYVVRSARYTPRLPEVGRSTRL
jgi:hypothetical protein